MQPKKAKFIVIYGVNNLGKTTQAKLLVNRMLSAGYQAEYLKYPVYEIEPSGAILNNYLREGNQMNLSAREAQIIYALNRTQFEYMLMQKLDDGINIIAEDYTGTGIAWGIGTGVNENFLKQINSHLLKEDVGLLLDGERYINSTEKNHKHEIKNELTANVRGIHLHLAREFGWYKINANQGIPQIHAKIWDVVKSQLSSLIKVSDSTQLKKDFCASKLNRELIQEQKNELKEKFKDEEHYINENSTTNKLREDIQDLSELKVQKVSSLTKLPSRSHTDDAGLDLYSSQYYTIMPGERALISTGVKFAIPKGCVGLIWDKSGIAKQGVHTMAGVIDSGYRGEVLVNLINLSNNIYTITPGQKVTQLLIQKVENFKIIEEKIKDNTSRGANGFGSTGLN